MREEKDIHPIDKLFQQSLEVYAPAPPSSAWKAIRKKVKAPKSGLTKWIGNHAGILIGSVSVLVITAALIFSNDIFNAKEQALIKQDSVITNRQLVKTLVSTDSSEVANTKTNPATIISKTTSNTKAQILTITAENTKNTTPITPILNVNSQATTSAIKPEQSISSPTVSLSLPGNENEPSTSSLTQQNTTKEKSENNDLHLLQPVNAGDVIANDTSATIPYQIKKRTQAEDTISPSSPKTDTPLKTTNPKTQNSQNKTTSWQTSFYGNSGMILQKQRDANFTYGAMGTIGLWHNNLKAGVETGVGVQAYKDKGELKNTYRIYDTLISIDTIWHQDSGFIYPEIITKYLPVSKDTNQFITFNHTYLYLQFPLLFTKQILALKKLSVDIKAGPVLGLQVSKSTLRKIVGNPEGGVLIKTENTNYTRLKTHWQILISPQIKYNLSKKVVFSLSPCLSLFPDKLYSVANRPKSTPYGISVYGGIIYRLK